MNIRMTQKPAIFITITQGARVNDADQLLYGIEEEGIPFLLTDDNVTALVPCAYRAACRSPLAVGVAIGQSEIVIHAKNLPADRPLFVLHDYSQRGSERVRDMGCNAARLVKGLPFK